MKNWYTRALVLLLVACLGAAVACGDSEEDSEGNSDTNQSSNQDPDNQDPNNQDPDNQDLNNQDPDNQDPNAGNGVPSSCDEVDEGNPGDSVATGDSDFDSEYELIFNDFAFDSGTPGSDLNVMIKPFLEQDREFPIIVLVELTDIDTQQGEVMIRAGAGLHADEPDGGEYVWDDELEEPELAQGYIGQDGQLNATLPHFNFVATMQTEDEDNLKTVIPIRDLQLDAELEAEADGSTPQINDGSLEGIIWLDDVEDMEIVVVPGNPGIPMTQALGTDEMNFEYSPDGTGCTGEANAWNMFATFSAEETVIIE